jgi:Ca2+-binding RTX toxin-like protein
VLVGGPGDTLTGGAGADTYVFGGPFGLNTITNYNSAKDVIQLSKTEFATLPVVQGDTHQVGANTVITYDTTDSITLVGVSASKLHFDASHFLLA